MLRDAVGKGYKDSAHLKQDAGLEPLRQREDFQKQVGNGRLTSVGGEMHDHALRWSGSADSAVDLHPTHLPDINESIAFAADDHQQVGIGQLSPVHPPHALLWNGSAESATDLHPPDYADSYAYAVMNGTQVGVGAPFAGFSDALLWRGTAESVVNLHAFLPEGFAWSKATAIDEAGHVFGVALNFAEQQWHAIEWVPVPEPSSIALLLPLAPASVRRTRQSCAPPQVRRRKISSWRSKVANGEGGIRTREGV